MIGHKSSVWSLHPREERESDFQAADHVIELNKDEITT